MHVLAAAAGALLVTLMAVVEQLAARSRSWWLVVSAEEWKLKRPRSRGELLSHMLLQHWCFLFFKPNVNVWIFIPWNNPIGKLQSDKSRRGRTRSKRGEKTNPEMDRSPLHVPWWRAVQSVQSLLQRSQDLGVLHHLCGQLACWGHTHTFTEAQREISKKQTSSTKESWLSDTISPTHLRCYRKIWPL